METIVKPQIVQLALNDGLSISVKRRLNVGEQQDMFAAMAPYLTAGDKPQLKSQAVMTAKVLAYLVSWTLTEDGVPLPLSMAMPEEQRLATLRSLDPDVFREIQEAINTHEAAVEQEIEERKNARRGGGAKTSSSSSLDAATGPTTTSVN